MYFYTEQTPYEKTSLHGLQGAWENFKHTFLCLHPFSGSDRIIFHLNEAMSWEMVRDLKKMKDVYLLIRNMCLKSEKAEELNEDLEEITKCLDEAVEEYGDR
uniref:Uncharacterized protein n=1 Tax=Desulfovibrio sp. U5L TaxID=596152 RepID=I2PWW7_9BACT